MNNHCSLRTLLLIAGAAFLLGVVTDRVLFSGERSREDPGLRASDRPVGKSANQARPAGTRDTKASSRPIGDRRQAPDRPPEDAPHPDDHEDGIPAVVRQALERIEQGERINLSVANSLLAQVSDRRQRREVIEGLAWHWGRQDPTSAAAWMDELSGRDQQVGLEAFLHGWAETNPAGAAAYAARLRGSEHSLHLVHRMAHVWAEHDQPAALDWGLGLSDPIRRQRALGGVMEFWAGNDPGAAASFAATVDSPYERHELLEIAARRWAGRDTAEAMTWAQSLQGNDRQHAANAVLHEVAELDPAAAAALYEDTIARHPAPGPQEAHAKRETTREIASIWAHSDPGAAADWAMGLPTDGEIRRGAVSEVAEAWLHVDQVEATDWIRELPDGATRDAAIDRVVHTLSREEHATAFEWAASISSPHHRTDLMHHVLDEWRDTDAPAARAAMNTAHLTPEQREHLGSLFGETPRDVEAPAAPDPAETP